MKFKAQGLNQNEIYCCSKQDIKTVFNDADIDVYFGYGRSRRESENDKYYRPYNNCKDTIVAYFVAHKRAENLCGIYIGSYLRFFILDKNNYNDENYELFLKTVLPELHKFYQKHKDDDMLDGYYCLTVGLMNGQYNFYEKKCIRF